MRYARVLALTALVALAGCPGGSPQPAPFPTQTPDPAPAPQPKQAVSPQLQQLLAAVEKLGGSARADNADAARPLLAIDFPGPGPTDADLAHLRPLLEKSPVAVDLNLTRSVTFGDHRGPARHCRLARRERRSHPAIPRWVFQSAAGIEQMQPNEAVRHKSVCAILCASSGRAASRQRRLSRFSARPQH